jgi:hypothetical protein
VLLFFVYGFRTSVAIARREFVEAMAQNIVWFDRLLVLKQSQFCWTPGYAGLSKTMRGFLKNWPLPADQDAARQTNGFLSES